MPFDLIFDCYINLDQLFVQRYNITLYIDTEEFNKHDHFLEIFLFKS